MGAIRWTRPEGDEHFIDESEPLLTEDGQPLLAQNETMLYTEG